MNRIKNIKQLGMLVIFLLVGLGLQAQANEESEPQNQTAKEKKLAREFRKKKARLYSPNNKDKTPQKEAELYKEAAKIEEEVPGTYTYYLTAYKTSNDKTQAFDKLQKAYQLQPKNAEVLKEMVNYGETNNEPELKKEFIEKLASNHAYSQAVLDYDKNVLNSVPNNSILITNGDEDTYPTWIQQEIHAVNPTVLVWNIENLQDKKYRNRVFIQAGIPPLTTDKTTREIIDYILSNKRAGEVFLALTLPHDVLKKYSSNLYLTGLALKYTTSATNNMELLQHNWESNFVLNHQFDADKINKNYLLPMVFLYQYYQSKGETNKALELKNAIKKLAKAQNITNPLSN